MRAPLPISNAALRSFDFLDDHLQLVLEQARSEDSILGREIYATFTRPNVRKFSAAWSRHRLDEVVE
jgi:hypothetical protein